MVVCEDCGQECRRRLRCPSCAWLICPWCWTHVHGPQSGRLPAAPGPATDPPQDPDRAELCAEHDEDLDRKNRMESNPRATAE